MFLSPSVRRTFLQIFSMLVLLAACLSPGVLMAQTLYGAATNDESGGGGVRPSSLYMIDPQTGDAQEIGPIGFNSVTGMTFLPDGSLIASANGDSEFDARTAILISIDIQTGQGTLIGVIDDNITGNCGRMPDISYDPTRNVVFGYGDSCSIQEGLYTIDPQTGAGTPAANPSGFEDGGNGLAVHPLDGTLYGTPIDSTGLITLDPATGIGTLIPASAGNGVNATNALEFNPVSLVLFGSFRDFNDTDNSFLTTIDLNDGTVTEVGQTILGLDALAFSNFCGDGITSVIEECDDANDTNGDGCENDCTETLCGNGVLDPGEECDDGNRIDEDGCSATCVEEAACGNGILDPGEQCDDGNQNDSDLCSNICRSNLFVSGAGCALNPKARPDHYWLIGLALFAGLFTLRNVKKKHP